jgi:hypothetical protein
VEKSRAAADQLGAREVATEGEKTDGRLEAPFIKVDDHAGSAFTSA